MVQLGKIVSCFRNAVFQATGQIDILQQNGLKSGLVNNALSVVSSSWRIRLHHSIPQYTTLHHSIPQYAIVYQSTVYQGTPHYTIV